MFKSLFSPKWVKVGQNRLDILIPCYYSNYKEVGQVGQNHLTHLYFYKSFTGNYLIVLPVSGSRFRRRGYGKKG